MRIRLYILFLVSLVLASCSEYLDRYPKDGLVNEEFWQTKEDLYKVILGAYALLAEMDAQLFLNGEVRADMIQQGADINTYANGNEYKQGEIKNVMEANIFANNKFAVWDNFYTVINCCNQVIKYAPIVQQRDNTLSDYYRKAYIAEATVLRSLMYFYLVRIYKDVPYIDYPIESDMADLYPSKMDGGDILDILIEELVSDKIADEVPDFHGSINETIGRVNLYTAYALIAEIALWNFDYDLAIDFLERIEQSGRFYVAANRWFTIFSEGNTNEGIFELQYTGVDPQSNKTYDLTINTSSKYFQCSTYATSLFLSDAFGNKSSEFTRTQGTLLLDYNGLHKIYKYIGSVPAWDNVKYGNYRSGNNARSANFIIYRYADIMLMKAEALSQKESPDLSLALEIINDIRKRADVPLLNDMEFGLTSAEAEETILRERALEMAYEGKRWYDLLRYARRNNYANKNQFIEKLTDNAPPSQRLVMASKLRNVYSWYLPIYQDEINDNKNLVQNPYYN